MFFSFLSDSKNLEEATARLNRDHVSNSPNLAGPTMLSRIPKVIKATAISDFVESEFLGKPNWPDLSINTEQEHDLSRSGYHRDQLNQKRLSE